MDSILECSSRTVGKILDRMNLGCFNCGWNACRCDLHHIVPQSKQGTDAHSNLAYLCPNCHRMAHSGLLTKFKSFADVVGDEWKNYYDVKPRTKQPRNWRGKRAENLTEKMQAARLTRSQRAEKRAAAAIKNLLEANIDKTRYGWIQQASKILNIAPQSVVRYLRKYNASVLDGAMIRQVITRAK